MRIALVSPLPPYRGGIATFSQMLGSRLQLRHDVYGVSFRQLYPPALFPGRSQTQPGTKGPALARSEELLDPLLPSSWDRAAARIRDFRPHLCLFAYWMPLFIPTYWRLMAAQRPTCRTIILCHNVQEHESVPALSWVKRRFFGAAGGIVVLSADGRRQLDSLGVTTPAETLFHPLYAGYGEQLPQATARKRLGIESHDPVILFFGLVRPYKGLGQLLEAARQLRQRGVRFHLRVAGEFYQGFREASADVARWDLAGQVTLEDRFIPDRQVATYFSAADVVVLPYLSATQSGVVQLAYQFERPVVVTAVGGLPEVVEAGQTGFVVPPGDSAALADTLASNLPEGFRALRPAVARAKNRYSWENFVGRLEQFVS